MKKKKTKVIFDKKTGKTTIKEIEVDDIPGKFEEIVEEVEKTLDEKINELAEKISKIEPLLEKLNKFIK